MQWSLAPSSDTFEVLTVCMTSLRLWQNASVVLNSQVKAKQSQTGTSVIAFIFNHNQITFFVHLFFYAKITIY